MTKYVSRWRRKNGLQDLEKARHFLEKLIESYHDGSVRPLQPYKVFSKQALGYCVMNELEGDERQIILSIATWADLSGLEQARVALDSLISANM